jgi:ubiquinone biosynthesis protein Coq4
MMSNQMNQTDTTRLTSQADVANLPPAIRWSRALRALGRILAHPEDTERVLEFSNLANAGRRDERLDLFFDHPVGARLYAERRAIDSTTVDLDALAALPEGTLGHTYATFMKAHGLTPNVFDGAPDEVSDERASYLIQRMRQTHDLWHVVTNCETDPAGEVALQAFTFAQVSAPSAGILAALGSLRAMPYTRQVLRDAIRMYRIGLRAERFPVFPWEDHWNTPLVEVRRMLGMPTHPAKVGGYLNELFEAVTAERARDERRGATRRRDRRVRRQLRRAERAERRAV